MKCPTCGKPGFKKPEMGRPQLVDDAEVLRLQKQGLTQREISKKLGISTGAVPLSLKRSKARSSSRL